jgi:CHAT domain-containing protein
MKSIFLLLANLIWASSFFAQKTEITTDTAAAYRLMREGQELSYKSQLRPSIDRYKKALEILSAAPPDRKTLACIDAICTHYSTILEPDSLRVYTERGEQILQQLSWGEDIPLEDFFCHRANYYRILQQYSTSIAWQKRSVAHRLRHFPNNVESLARSYNQLGVIYMENGQFDSSMLMAQEALQHFRTLPAGRENQLQLARCLQNIGILYKEMNRYGEAIVHYEEALGICSTQKDGDLEARILYNTGFAVELQGDFERSLDYFQKAYDVFVRLHGENAPVLAIVLNKLANNYFQLSNYDAALAAQQRSIAITQEKLGPQHPRIGISKISLSDILAALGQKQAALQSAKESAAILEKNYAQPHPSKLSAYNTLVTRYYEVGIQHDSVFQLVEKCVADAKFMYGERAHWTSIALATKSMFLDGPQHRLEALATIQESLIAASRNFDSRDITQNPAPEDYLQPRVGLARLQSKGVILAGLWRDRRRPEDLALALHTFEQGREVLQYHLQKIGAQSTSEYVLTEWALLCKDALSVSMVQHELSPSPENLARCFRWMEREKAQKLRAATQNAKAKAFAGLPDALLSRDAELAQQVNDLEEKLFKAEESKDSTAIAQLRGEQIFAAKQARADFVRGLERDYPTYFSLKYETAVAELPDVQKQLAPGTLLLELAFGKLPFDSSLYLFTVTHSAAHIKRVPCQKGLTEKVTRLNQLLQNQSLVQTSRRKEFAQISSELYAQFIQPIEKELVGIKKIIVIGEGITHLLPFEVLQPSPADLPFEHMDFWVKQFDISYHYSAALLSNKPPSEPTFVREWLAFAPVFDFEQSKNTPLMSSDWSSSRDTSLRALGPDDQWAPLPWTEKEVRRIEQLFKAKKQNTTSVLLRAQATESNLRAESALGARCVHIASHSFADVQRPKFSGIACTTSGTDGTLFVGEVYSLRVPADLVVLSSCESGKGKLLQMEGPLGLNRAFFHAGAQNVLFSLWKVNDRATGDLMVRFYQFMLDGHSYASAPRQAKLKMLADPALATPNLWSSFLLIGK